MSRPWRVMACHTDRSARALSDHLPVIGDIRVTAPAGQERIIQPPGGLRELRADKQRLIADHHIAQECLIGFRQLAERLLIIELQRMIAQRERAPGALH